MSVSHNANPAHVTRTLYLHSGPLKTGSTAIQAFFRENADIFRRQALYWPVTGTEINGNYHRGLVAAFVPGHATASLTAKLADELRQEGLPEKVLVSAEMFAGRFGDPAYLGNIKSFCQRLGYHLHIITVIRPQAPLLNSLFTQQVKIWRPVVIIDNFLKHEIATGQHHYATLFAHALNGTGMSFTALPFNRAILSQGLGRAMCGVMDLDANAAGLREIKTVNTSPDPRTVAAFQRLRRRISADFPQLDRERLAALTWPILRAADSLGWTTGKYGGFDAEQQSRIAEHFAPENDAFARAVWSKSWTDIFAPEEIFDPPHNVFAPETADKPAREEFRAFMKQALETIAEFAAAGGSQNSS